MSHQRRRIGSTGYLGWRCRAFVVSGDSDDDDEFSGVVGGVAAEVWSRKWWCLTLICDLSLSTLIA